MLNSKTPRAVLPRILTVFVAFIACWFLLGLSGVGSQALADTNDAIENAIEGENNSDDALNEDLGTNEGEDEGLVADDEDDEGLDADDEDDEGLDADGEDDEGLDADGEDDEGLDADDDDDEWYDDEDDEDLDGNDDENLDEDGAIAEVYVTDCMYCYDTISDICYSDDECGYALGKIAAWYQPAPTDGSYDPELVASSFEIAPRYATCGGIALNEGSAIELAETADVALASDFETSLVAAADPVAVDEGVAADAVDAPTTDQVASADEIAFDNAPATSNNIEEEPENGKATEKAPLDTAAKAAVAFAAIGFLALRRKR